MIDTTYEAAKRDQQLSNLPPATSRPGSESVHVQLPAYMTEVYDWAYVAPSWVRWLDHNIVVKTLLFCNDQRLMSRYLKRIRAGMHVWQVAHVYGNLVQRAAAKVGHQGCFHLTDVTPIQVSHGKHKLKDCNWAKVIHHDASTFQGDVTAPYDLICSFMLLHEVPDIWKRAVVDNMLAQMPAGGEVLFVDYHRPAIWHPVRYILQIVNRLLEPFANALWEHEISHFASTPESYEWHKETIFGGVYQIVSVRHKTGS